MKMTEQFDAALAGGAITAERGASYAHPSVDFRRAAIMKTVTAECPDARIRHALDMILTKVARLVQSPDHVDSWIDIAGYARTACMVLDHDESTDRGSPSDG